MLAPNQATSAALPLIAQQVKTEPSKPNEGPSSPRRVDPSRQSQATSPDPARLPDERAAVSNDALTQASDKEAERLAKLTSAGVGSEGTRNLLAGQDTAPQAAAAEAAPGVVETTPPTTSLDEDVDPVTGLTDSETEVVRNLQQRDREVRDHEEAHARVGGRYASEPSYDMQVGPDGRNYAIGGSVQIDISPVKDDLQATIAKMEVVKAAALAPAEPSPADRRVAALAESQRLAAIAELRAQRQADLSDADYNRLLSELFRQTETPADPVLDLAA
ncbi:MAG: putative metalloprotease CJM1_0395 family protein [Pseudomonadota bacterium]